MEITSIEMQKKRSNRYSIFIDNKFAFGLDGVDLLFYKLKEGDTLSQEKYDIIMDNVIFSDAKNVATNFISFKQRTHKEVINKLQSKGFDEITIDKVMILLEKYNYINDFNYALSYIKEKSNLNNEGLIKIKYNLKLKGISDEIINNAIEESDINSIDTIVKLLDKKIKDKQNISIKEKNQVFNFLIRKGFSYDDIYNAYNIFIDN